MGISGSIAAYKSAILTRLLVKAGANVRVVMTSAAKEFITPLTLSTLSKNPVLSEFTSGKKGLWNNHVEISLWADIILIAPATADLIAKMSAGICDNLLLAIYLSSKSPVLFAPAMDLDMFQHPTLRANLKKLSSYGNSMIPPENGELASGLMGEGRMAEPEAIVKFLVNHFAKNKPLFGMKALVTAGPTYEAIDPVRFIGNHSSGKMGFAIAESMADRGAEVTLICGPNSLKTNSSNITRVDVTSAAEMYDACMNVFKQSSIVVMAAAVADFTPTDVKKLKIKKQNFKNTIELSATKDILEKFGKLKSAKQFIVGFALETDNGIVNAKKKLQNKNINLIVLNAPTQTSGFGVDTNEITIVDKKSIRKIRLMQKLDVANELVNEIISRIK